MSNTIKLMMKSNMRGAFLRRNGNEIMVAIPITGEVFGISPRETRRLSVTPTQTADYPAAHKGDREKAAKWMQAIEGQEYASLPNFSAKCW